MNLVFTGIQGCGKGTQARILIEKHGFEIVEMGGELRKIAEEDNDFGRKIKKTIELGNLVTPDMISDIIKKVVLANEGKKMIFDGFIRNKGNKDAFEEVCPDYKVIFFELSEGKAKNRLLGRMFDPITQETFMSGIIKNPKTGTELIKRKDDNKKSILTRINSFVNTTLPIVEIQKKEGKIININADQSIENVASEIVSKLNLK